MPLLVKICGLSTPDALDAALDAGADMVGFVFFEPSPRNLGLEAARPGQADVQHRAGPVECQLRRRRGGGLDRPHPAHEPRVPAELEIRGRHEQDHGTTLTAAPPPTTRPSAAASPNAVRPAID